jgi:hypothetical protein
LGKSWKVLQWKVLVCILQVHLVYFMAIWYILCPFGIFYGHLVHLFPILVRCAEKNLAILDSDLLIPCFAALSRSYYFSFETLLRRPVSFETRVFQTSLFSPRFR